MHDKGVQMENTGVSIQVKGISQHCLETMITESSVQ